MKYCSTCAQFKPDRKFHKDTARPTGLAHKCMDCCAKYQRDYYRKNRDRLNDYSKKYYREALNVIS